MRRIPFLLFALSLVACTGDGVTPPPGGRPPPATLIAENLELLPGEDNAVRFGFQAAGGAASIRIAFEPDGASVSVCPITGVDAALPDRSLCRNDVGSGVREPVSARGLAGVALIAGGSGAVQADVVLEFDEGGREVGIRLPLIRAPRSAAACSDNACNPFFELVPTRSGSFTAEARWADGGPATLALLQGRVRARSYTATGVPYHEPARADGASPLRISTRLSAPGEYALIVRPQQGASPIREIAIDGSWS